MLAFIKALETRGILDNFSSGLTSLSRPLSAYLGFDPTASSLHIGHWIGICFLRRLAQYDITPIALVGGATGMIGDPAGKSVERSLLQSKEIAANAAQIEACLKKYLPDIQVVNNASWIEEMSVISFLRDVGKHFRLGPMLSKETIKQRVSSEEGISFTEFSYILLQSLDFAHLFRNHGVILQCGGSDQWGNITAGIDYIRKLGLGQAYGLTYPLLTNSQGKKIGKTESGTLWLDPSLTSPYELYQYFLRLPDDAFPTLVRTLTLLSNQDVFDLDQQMLKDPINTKKIITEVIIADIHGNQGVLEAQTITKNMFSEKRRLLSENDFHQLLSTGYGIKVAKQNVIGKRYVDIFVEVGLCGSKGEARRLIAQKGLYLNGAPLEDEYSVLSESHLCFGSFILLSQGKKRKQVLYLTE